MTRIAIVATLFLSACHQPASADDDNFRDCVKAQQSPITCAQAAVIIRKAEGRS